MLDIRKMCWKWGTKGWILWLRESRCSHRCRGRLSWAPIWSKGPRWMLWGHSRKPWILLRPGTCIVPRWSMRSILWWGWHIGMIIHIVANRGKMASLVADLAPSDTFSTKLFLKANRIPTKHREFRMQLTRLCMNLRLVDEVNFIPNWYEWWQIGNQSSLIQLVQKPLIEATKREKRLAIPLVIKLANSGRGTIFFSCKMQRNIWMLQERLQ